MGMESWKKVLELAVGNPELIVALAYIVGFLFVIAAGATSLAWLIRGEIDKGRMGALEGLLMLAKAQSEDVSQKLAHAAEEGAKLREQIQSRESTQLGEYRERIAARLADWTTAMESAGTANTAAMRITSPSKLTDEEGRPLTKKVGDSWYWRFSKETMERMVREGRIKGPAVKGPADRP